VTGYRDEGLNVIYNVALAFEVRIEMVIRLSIPDSGSVANRCEPIKC
jgi:hypothetical protein